MQINQVILVDLYPGKGASVTANVSFTFIHLSKLICFVDEMLTDEVFYRTI